MRGCKHAVCSSTGEASIRRRAGGIVSQSQATCARQELRVLMVDTCGRGIGLMGQGAGGGGEGEEAARGGAHGLSS